MRAGDWSICLGLLTLSGVKEVVKPSESRHYGDKRHEPSKFASICLCNIIVALRTMVSITYSSQMLQQEWYRHVHLSKCHQRSRLSIWYELSTKFADLNILFIDELSSSVSQLKNELHVQKPRLSIKTMRANGKQNHVALYVDHNGLWRRLT